MLKRCSLIWFWIAGVAFSATSDRTLEKVRKVRQAQLKVTEIENRISKVDRLIIVQLDKLQDLREEIEIDPSLSHQLLSPTRVLQRLQKQVVSLQSDLLRQLQILDKRIEHVQRLEDPKLEPGMKSLRSKTERKTNWFQKRFEEAQALLKNITRQVLELSATQQSHPS